MYYIAHNYNVAKILHKSISNHIFKHFYTLFLHLIFYKMQKQTKKDFQFYNILHSYISK